MSIAPGRVANELWGMIDPREIERLSAIDQLYVTSDDVAAAALFMLSRPPHVTVRNLVILAKNQDV